jgi:phenol 2-monooxygenase (NADPH)
VDGHSKGLCPSSLVIGERIPPIYVLRAADARVFHLHDLLPSDTRFKLLVFCGDVISDSGQKLKLTQLAQQLEAEDSILKKYAPAEATYQDVFDLITVMMGKKEEVIYTQIPLFFRSPWTK